MSESFKSSSKPFKPPVWLKPDGSVLACVEKIKVLNENLAELRDLAQDALDDAVLMGGTQAQIKQTLLEIIEGLDSQYPEQTSGVTHTFNLPPPKSINANCTCRC